MTSCVGFPGSGAEVPDPIEDRSNGRAGFNDGLR